MEREEKTGIRTCPDGGIAGDDGNDDIVCPHCGLSINMLSSPSKSPMFGLTSTGKCSCSRCGYEWKSTVDRPRRCPSCGSYHWDDERVTLRCLRCDHQWDSRKSSMPVKCPKCRSVYWNIPPERTVKAPSGNTKRDLEIYDRVFGMAVERCVGGEAVLDVCRELDVSVIQMLATLRERGVDHRLRDTIIHRGTRGLS